MFLLYGNNSVKADYINTASKLTKHHAQIQGGGGGGGENIFIQFKIILKYKRIYDPLHPCLSIILLLCILTKILVNLIQSLYFLLSIYLEGSISSSHVF